MTVSTLIHEEEWIEQYQPIANPLRNDLGFDYGDGSALVDDSEAELAYLDNIEAKRIWTVIDREDDTVIVPGRYKINALGHIITQNAWSDETLMVYYHEN